MPKTAKTQSDSDQVFELTNITVQEVSLVDRAANQRSFLVKKRATKKSDGEGVKLVDQDGEEVMDLNAAPANDASDPAADLDAADAARAEEARKAEEAAEAEREKALTAKATAEEHPKAEEVPTAEEAGKETPAAHAPEAAPAAPAVEAAAEPAAEPTPAPEPAAAPAVEAAAEPAAEPAPVSEPAAEPAPTDDVAKAGRKMAKARLERLKGVNKSASDVCKALADLIGEMDIESQEEDATTFAKADEALSEALKKAQADLASAVGERETLTKERETLTKERDDARAEISRLAKLVETLQTIVNEKGAELEQQKSVVKSNALSGESRTIQHDSLDVQWDYDMAAKQDVRKGRRF